MMCNAASSTPSPSSMRRSASVRTKTASACRHTSNTAARSFHTSGAEAGVKASGTPHSRASRSAARG